MHALQRGCSCNAGSAKGMAWTWRRGGCLCDALFTIVLMGEGCRVVSSGIAARRLLRRSPAIAACSSSMHEQPPFHACLECQCAASCMPRLALRVRHAAAASRPRQHQHQPSQRQRNNLEPGGIARAALQQTEPLRKATQITGGPRGQHGSFHDESSAMAVLVVNC